MALFKKIDFINHRTMYRTLIIILSLFTLQASAQNDLMLAQFMFHEHIFNPAAAGSTRNLTIGGVARQQWTGFSGAPSSQALNASLFIPSANSGVGVVFVADRLGFERYINARVSYAYHQKVGQGNYLSAGISFGILNTYVKGDELIFERPFDQNSFNTREGEVRPDIGFGLEFNGKGLVLGASVTHLHQSLTNSTVFRVPRHYFGYAKYNWDVTKKILLTPAVFVRSSQFITQADIAFLATFSKMVITGISYRTTDDVAAILGVIISKQLQISYSFDFDFGELRNHNSGSHEISLIARLKGLKEKQMASKSPRYF